MPLPLPVLPMTIDEFHVMKHRLGWKHEYWDGAARLSPQSTAVADFERTIERTDLSGPVLAEGYYWRALRLEDEQELIQLFIETFDASVEYAGWEDDFYHRDAKDSIQSFLGSAEKERSRGRKTGELAHSFVIALGNHIVAAILVRRNRRGPIVEPIMVGRDHQRRGLGRALLRATGMALQNAGIEKLYSRCQLGNAASLGWHEQNGFREIPNYFSATHRQRHYAWLARHYEHKGRPTHAAEMRRVSEHWDAVIETLEKSGNRWSSELLE